MAAAQLPAHPLDPLSPEELSSVARILRTEGKAGTNAMFISIALHEPPKEEVLAWTPGAESRREGFAVVWDTTSGKTFEAVVDLRSHASTSWRTIPGVLPMWSYAEDLKAEALVRNDPDWRAAMRLRGITNFTEVMMATWMPGHARIIEPRGDRFFRVLFHYKGTGANSYGPPIEGVEAIVNLTRGKVQQIIDTGVRPMPKQSVDFFDPRVRGGPRPALKPLIVSQPEGSGFRIDGNEIQWDRWRFRYSFNAREGLVLHQIRYVDDGRERSILYRASLSEMLVPYGDPSETWFWRNAVDEGEYGLGNFSAPLLPGRNTPQRARLLPVPMADNAGDAALWPDRIDVYERESGVLWSHFDGLAPANEARNGRELVIGFIATVGNYDYAYHWFFKQDASIEFVAELTGIILTKGVTAAQCPACARGGTVSGTAEPTGEDRYGTLVAPQTIGVNHQHFINMRLDFDIDGVGNSVREINVNAAPSGRANRAGNAFVAIPTVFGREREAARDVNPASRRLWAVFNPDVTTALGHHPSYMLHPGGNALPFLPPSSPVRKAAGFVDHHFFATRYHPWEQFAGGRYPAHAPKPDNVVTWGGDNESILNSDVVVWYTFGITHAPRPEDFPVMPAVRAGFQLSPEGFFTQNPALDLPPAQ
jgi:primary-amine oxidase